MTVGVFRDDICVTNAPALVDYMIKIFKTFLDQFVVVFIDDILIFKTFLEAAI